MVIYLFFLFLNRIYLVGGEMMLIFNHPQSNVSIINSFFQANSADMIGCVYAYQKKGIVFLKNNIFFKNIAITINRVLVGSASVLQISGIFASVISEGNHFYFNNAEYSAIIGIYYGYFKDTGSFFHGFIKNKIRIIDYFEGNLANSFTINALFSQGTSNFISTIFFDNYAYNSGYCIKK